MMSSEMFNTSFIVSGEVTKVSGSAAYVFLFPLFLLFYIIASLHVFFIDKVLEFLRGRK